jgi:sialate O-acetylesterase
MNRPILLALLLASAARADVTLPAIFSEGMVLQQQQLVPVWGTAEPGEKIEVSFGEQKHETMAGKDRRWNVMLNPLNASDKPTPLVVKGQNTITLANVLVGEVWVCSGQSNMGMSVSRSLNAAAEIAAAKFPAIRMFTVERSPAAEPQSDCKGAWKEANPANTGEFSAAAYFFGRHLHQVLKVPVGLINTSWGGTRVEAWTSDKALAERPCAQEMLADWKDHVKSWDATLQQAIFEKAKADWQAKVKLIDEQNKKLPAGAVKKPRPAAPRPPDDPTKTPHRPSVLFNGMVAPIVPYGMKGAIWYQGESNQRRAFQYQELLPTLINDWRARWESEFPFYIVQLASFGNGQPPATEPGLDDTWAELQEAQFLTAITLPKCGLAAANDIGEEKDIHPKNKQEVGRRLALWALASDYGKNNTVFSGPLYKTSYVKDGRIRVQFDHAATGLKTRDGKAPQHFQITGADKKWHWAQAKIEGGEVVVWHDGVKEPIAVRYAWAAWPANANLTNAEGLPASCFRTDDFIPSTLGVTSPFKEKK